MRRERERLAAVLEQTADGVVIVDVTGDLTYADPAFLAANGLALVDLVGQSAASVAERLVGPDGLAAMQEAAVAGEPWLRAIDQIAGDGILRHLEVSVTPVHDQQGTIGSYVVLIRDVTPLREAQADLAQEAQVRAVLAESLHTIPPEATLEEAAQSICEGLRTLPFVDASAIEAFLGPDEVQVIAQAAPAGYPLPVEFQLPPDRARFVRDRAAAGPWAEYANADLLGRWIDAPRTGLAATAHGPIVHGDHVDGVLVIGTFHERFAHTLVEKMPGIVSLQYHLQRAARGTAACNGVGGSILVRHLRPWLPPRRFTPSSSRSSISSRARSWGMRPDAFDPARPRTGASPRRGRWAWAPSSKSPRLRRPSRPPAAALGRWLDVNVSPRLLADPESLRAVLWLGATDRSSSRSPSTT